MKNVRCDIIEDTKNYHTVRFYLKNRVAFLTVWHNGIIEEQITDEEDPYAAYVIPDDLMW